MSAEIVPRIPRSWICSTRDTKSSIYSSRCSSEAISGCGDRHCEAQATPIVASKRARTRASSSHGVGTESSCSARVRSEEHTSELQSRFDLVCRLLLEEKKV